MGTLWFTSAANVIARTDGLTDDDHAALMALKANPVKVAATPATVASEPVAWANGSNLTSAAIAHQRGAATEQHTWNESKTTYHDTPLYRHPATEAEALAVLVAAGWKELKGSDGLSQAFNELWKCRRVLIAPEGE